VIIRVLVLCCASSLLLAQHEGHGPPAARTETHAEVRAALQYSEQGSLRGGRRIALLDWEHLSLRRPAGPANISFRAMTSVSGLVNRGPGTPSLLQSGGTYRHGYIHDRDHPHDLIMEAAIAAQVPLPGRASATIYAAAVGSPALGPTAWMHRPSAASDPVAPLGHHWQDATHASYGVVTSALSVRSLTLEASAFNARESDYVSPWPDFRGARLDSYAGRIGVGGGGFEEP
jgi:hypothetical protein